MIAIGYENDAIPAAEMISAAVDVRASWVRIIGTPASELAPIRDRIRAAHGAGLNVVLTVGGIGTRDKQPGVAATLRWLEKLPRTERVSWTNEPDLTGMNACQYGRGWRKLRRWLGRRLLWGELSPYFGVRFSMVALLCAHVRGDLDVSAHPYDVLPGHTTLAAGDMTMPHLRRAERAFRRMGVRARWWITEFGYAPADSWRWPTARRRAQAAGAAVLVAYDVQGPTWNTKLDEAGRAALRAR
jgi:hypothetical protein